MKTNVLSYLERSVLNYPERIALIDETSKLTYQEVHTISRRIGTALSHMVTPKQGVGVYMEKNAQTLCVFFGAVYAGCYYCALNTELPATRLSQIVSVLEPGIIVTSRELETSAKEIFPGMRIVLAEDLMQTELDLSRLDSISRSSVDTDPLYVNFTSGSTGVPKGIVVGHRSVLDFIDCFTELFHFTCDDVIANQAPFDFDVSVKDIYSALATGASLVVIPRRLFSMPAQLVDFLCEHRTTTMVWAVSAICLLTTFHALDYKTPETINKILFSGEVMPFKALKELKKHLPNAMLVNVYGPTEITCNCTYHILEAERDYSGGIPIGLPFPNEDVFLLDSEDHLVTERDVSGEICVRGTALALGYYRNPEQNDAHFVQNPLNPFYPERIYRTGDLGHYNQLGELVFSGRKDFQIKYMGHRIELEEIEREMAAIHGVDRCCCVFDEKKSRLKGFYIGTIPKEEVHAAMKAKLPDFMIPGILRQVEDMPLNKNGKIDRKALDAMAGGRTK